MEKMKKAAIARVNIPRSVDDPNHRYNRPVLAVGTVGQRGNQRTVLTNVKQVARALGRDPKILMHYIAVTAAAAECGENSIRGVHRDDDLDNIVELFCRKYVLCGACVANPETIPMADGALQCRACGWRRLLSRDDPIDRQMIDEGRKHPNRVARDPSPAELGWIFEKGGGGSVGALEGWSVDTAAWAVKRRRETNLGDGG